jgi:hypothetical protein
MGQTDSSGQHYMPYGMAGSPARKDYEDMRYMEKAASKLIDRDKKSMRVTAQEQGKKYTRSKPSSKKPTKKISTKR